MATTLTALHSPLSGMLTAIYKRAQITLTHDLSRAWGDHAKATRLRAKHAFLRLAGPKGRLP